MDLDAENRFQEGLGDFLVAENHREHELVGDREFLERNTFSFHFVSFPPAVGGNMDVLELGRAYLLKRIFAVKRAEKVCLQEMCEKLSRGIVECLAIAKRGEIM